MLRCWRGIWRNRAFFRWYLVKLYMEFLWIVISGARVFSTKSKKFSNSFLLSGLQTQILYSGLARVSRKESAIQILNDHVDRGLVEYLDRIFRMYPKVSLESSLMQWWSNLFKLRNTYWYYVVAHHHCP